MRSLVYLFALCAIASAHHGQDFFLNLDARVPDSGGVTSFATLSAGEGDFSLEPGVIAGLGHGLAAGLSLDFTDDGSFHAAALTPLLQWSAPLGGSPFRLGAAVSYHFADSSRQSFSLSSAGDGHEGHIHRSLKGFNPDAPPRPTPQPEPASASNAASSSTIHLHDEDYFLARIIGEWAITSSTRGLANLIFAGTSSSHIALGYSMGVRHDFGPKWAVGLEAMGDFNTHGYHQVVASLIHSPRHNLGLRLGLGHGVGSAGEGPSIHSGITWRF